MSNPSRQYIQRPRVPFDDAPRYRKITAVDARRAVEGELVRTRLAGGQVESLHRAAGNEVAVSGGHGKQYVLPAEQFLSAFVDIGAGRCVHGGSVRAIRNPYGREITVATPWGTIQHGESDCWIAEIPGIPGQIFLIGATEFSETYTSDVKNTSRPIDMRESSDACSWRYTPLVSFLSDG